MSLAECTARSMRPSSSASSISLVNRPLPPTSASGRSWMASPVVRMMLSSIASSDTPSAAASRARTVRACTSASGLPRVPMRKMVVADCVILPHDARASCSPPFREKGGPAHRPRIEKPMIVLGIETTCDETAAAVVERSETGPRQDPVQYRAVAGERACRLRRRGAGDRRARPCRGARPHHRQGHGRRPAAPSTSIDGIAAAAGPGPDRRRHRRPDHRQGDRAGQATSR